MAGESNKLHSLESILQDIKAVPCHLSLQLLRDITNDFSDERELGRGGFGVVYKGVLNSGDIVAVKKLVSMPEVKDRQFQNEVHHLLLLKHQNIVRFLGYCSETRQVCMEHKGAYRFVEIQERLLCLEYMPNGSLERHISDESCGLDWHKRYKIIKGICYGLHYLHEERKTNTPIIHLDLKPANVLLTSEMEPKITDFGLSRLFGEQQSRIYTTRTEGTLGYMAREYMDKGIITKKSDIFSFGVIIIEIITGHRDYPGDTGTSMQDFVENVVRKWKNRLQDLRYTSLEKDCEQIRRCTEIGLSCVKIDEKQRPTTKEIIKCLTKWDSMNLQVIYKEWPLTDQVHQKAANALQAIDNSPSNSITPKEPPKHIRVCARCKNPIDHRRLLGSKDLSWHQWCFRCVACNKHIYENEFSVHEDQPYHRSCYKEFFHQICVVCNNFIPLNGDGLIEYRAHPFWKQNYCPSHEYDGTSRCCSCERIEFKDIKYITLDDGRKLCLECLNSAVMDTSECQNLYVNIEHFFEGLDMKLEHKVPLLLVESQTINEIVDGKNEYHLPGTRGLCLFEEMIVTVISGRPKIGLENKAIEMITCPYKVFGQCKVTAILILYGLPRLLTGAILAHEMMHVYLRLRGYKNLSPDVEEGICQVLAYMWLDSKFISHPSDKIASRSSVASSTPISSNEDAKTKFEDKLGAFIKNQIEVDSSESYGNGFRDCAWAVEHYGLRSTLDHIKMTGSLPYR